MPKTLNRTAVKAMPCARLDFVSLWSESSDDGISSGPSSGDEKKPILRKASLAGTGAEGRTKHPTERASGSKQMAASKRQRCIRKSGVDLVCASLDNRSNQSSIDESSSDPRCNVGDMKSSSTWTNGSSTPDSDEAPYFSESATFRLRSSPQFSPLYARKLQF
jgi:hypothetical protein